MRKQGHIALNKVGGRLMACVAEQKQGERKYGMRLIKMQKFKIQSQPLIFLMKSKS